MNRSPEIHELATALAKAQGAIEDAEKDRTNPHFKSRYADLASVRDAIRSPLSSNGLSFVQLARGEGGHVEVETILMHSSGQFISEVLAMPVGQNTPQGFGSALTYARRYSLMAIVGVAAAEDDDDGDAASRQPMMVGETPPTNIKFKEPAVSPKAIAIGRELRACRSIADLAAFKATEEFQAAWKTINGVDRAYLANAAEKRKSELDAPAEAEPANLLAAG